MSPTTRLTKSMQAIDAAFRKIKQQYDERHSDSGLVCKQGFYLNSSVLKLQKPFWTNDPMNQPQNSSGIFFSIWMYEESIAKSRAPYNIHALKLRKLKGYSITSKDFAEKFRNNFVKKSWPNVSVDFGPLTLMEGWIEVDLNNLQESILPLLERFHRVSPIIDRLLKERVK